MKTKTNEQKTEGTKRIEAAIKDGQSGEYLPYVRRFTGALRDLLKIKATVRAAILITEIDDLLQILDPQKQNEIQWFKNVREALVWWTNERVMTSRLLGEKGEWDGDREAFYSIVKEQFPFFYKKMPSKEDVFGITFDEMASLVEWGHRRFAR